MKNLITHYYNKFYNNKYIQKFGKLVGAQHLWDFTKDSTAKGIAIGMGCAWIPLPFHTTIAIALAILLDANIPLAAVAIWFANPITMPFMYYYAYLLGDFLLNIHSYHIKFHLSIQDVLHIIEHVWEPFLLGCAVLGVIIGFLTYITLLFFLKKSFNRRQ